MLSFGRFADPVMNETGSSVREDFYHRVLNSVSIEGLRTLPPEVRGALKGELVSGYASADPRKAGGRVLEAEVTVSEISVGITIKGSESFVSITRSHLANIAKITVGERLLQSITSSGKKVTIISTLRVNETFPHKYEGALTQGKVLRWRSPTGELRSILGDGTGSSTTVKYNPKSSRVGPAEWQKSPAEIWLAHELIHADDAAYGRIDPEETDGFRNYERQAIGLPPFEQKEFTENKLRLNWPDPQPPRACY